VTLRVVLGICGGIAAYKTPALARLLLKADAEVRVALTAAGGRFVGAATFAGLTGKPVVTDLWGDSASGGGEVHVELAAWADAMVLVPATANVMARVAHGMADDAVTATALCLDSDKPLLIAPAMHPRMWASHATRVNVAHLAARGARFLGPVHGEVASGESGVGRMMEPEALAEAILAIDRAEGDLRGLHVLVSAGPTHEPIDPVRYLGNRSSGRMGFALAEAARDRGAVVTLVLGPVALEPPPGIRVLRVRSALEMQAAIEQSYARADAIVMAAAVADFRPEQVAEHKIKKRDGEPPPTITLVRNPDILAGLGERRRREGKGPRLIGFAVETEDLVASARKKLETKGVDLVVANAAGVAFEGDTNEATLVSAQGEEPTGKLTKRQLADRILDRIHTDRAGR
jgi:phosphopantothenoylcysteine decarboxylase / phosphopantothenate---cysteine ligase